MGLFTYTDGKACQCMSFVLHFLSVQLVVWHLILIKMQYDHTKRTLDYILVTPDLQKVEVV